MILIPDLAQRQLQSELMDDPCLDSVEHASALNGLTRLNILSRTVGTLWKPIRQAAIAGGGRTLRVLDIATGSGDIPIGLQEVARRSGVALAVDACDISPRAVAMASERSKARRVAIRFFRLDALHETLDKSYDVVMCSLFMHHLTPQEVVRLLGNMRAATRGLVLVSDLRRGLAGYALAYVATRMFTRSRVVHVDSLLSVRAAFTLSEFRALAEQAGLHHASVARRMPCRFLLKWTKGGDHEH